MKIITLNSPDSSVLTSLKAFNVQNNPFPIIFSIEKTPIPIPKPPKMTVDDVIEDFKYIAVGKISKKEIVAAVIEKYPDITKLSISKKIDEIMIRTRVGTEKAKKYHLKSALENVIDPFSITNSVISTSNSTSQTFSHANTGVTIQLPFSPCQPLVKPFVKPKLTTTQTTGSTQS